MKEKGYDWCEKHGRKKTGFTSLFCPLCEQEQLGDEDIIAFQDEARDNLFWLHNLRNVTGRVGAYTFKKTTAGPAVEGTLFVGGTRPVPFFINSYIWKTMKRPPMSGKIISSGSCSWNMAMNRLVLLDVVVH